MSKFPIFLPVVNVKLKCICSYYHCKVIILRIKQSSACQKKWIVNNGITLFQSKFLALLSIAALEILGFSQVLRKPESTLSIIGVRLKQHIFTIKISLKDSPENVKGKLWKGFMVGEAYKSSLNDLKLASPHITNLLALLQVRQPAVLLEFKFPNTNTWWSSCLAPAGILAQLIGLKSQLTQLMRLLSSHQYITRYKRELINCK